MFSGTFNLFKIAGIQVTTNWTILFLFLIGGTPWGIVALLLAVLTHELAHAFAARQVGARADRIFLGFVGLAFYSGRLKPLQTAWVAFAGPLINIVFGLFSWYIFHNVNDHEFFQESIIWAGVFGALNLIPLVPLDGSCILESLSALKLGQSKARLLALKVTMILSVAFIMLALSQDKLIVMGVGLSPLMVCLLLGYCFFKAFVEYKARSFLGGAGMGMWESMKQQMNEASENRREAKVTKVKEKTQANEMEVRAKMDQLLVKISRDGMSSLTPDERAYLTDNSSQYPKS